MAIGNQRVLDPSTTRPDPARPGDDMTTRQMPGWSVQVGPLGRGTCLTSRDADGRTMIIAPPGVPLAPPEPIAELMSWRGAKWAHGRIVAGPTPSTLAGALEDAPDQHTWIRERQDDYVADAAVDWMDGGGTRLPPRNWR